MNAWCCAAIAIGGGESPQPPMLEAPPVQVQTEPLWRTSKIRPRAPVARQALPPINPPEGSVPLTASVRAGVPAPVDMNTPTAATLGQARMEPVSYSQMQIGNERVAYEYVQPKTSWWRRLLGIRPDAPTMRSAPGQTIQPAPPQTMAMSASQGVGRPMQRETWRPAAAAMTPPPSVVQPAAQSSMQTAERQTHTVRKPATMLRDAADWDTSKAYPYSKQKAPATPKDQEQSMLDWSTATVMPDVAKEGPKAVPSSDWTSEVIRKTMEHNAVPQSAKTPPAVAATAHAEKADRSPTFAGMVSWTQAAGGHWVLKTESGDYLLKGDPAILRLRVGDRIEVQGAIKNADALGMPAVIVEKLSLSAKR